MRSGAWMATCRRHVGPERHPADHGLVDAELVEQRHHVVGVGVHPVRRSVAGLVRLPVAGEVEEDHPVSPLGQVGGQAPVELGVEQEAVHEHQRRPVPWTS